eukprot:TRINITY_DN2795_c2_g1_i2.p2 TRINITY_DN2795_c2_g1~~TRINITY_DN2795_c2_g1_i2.p2  ORF type:complete len:184 (+),score=18.78 TRINITY_DN2795_c2_g1_i2:560-1111(+)
MNLSAEALAYSAALSPVEPDASFKSAFAAAGGEAVLGFRGICKVSSRGRLLRDKRVLLVTPRRLIMATRHGAVKAQLPLPSLGRVNLQVKLCRAAFLPDPAGSPGAPTLHIQWGLHGTPNPTVMGGCKLPELLCHRWLGEIRVAKKNAKLARAAVYKSITIDSPKTSNGNNKKKRYHTGSITG